ncbi:outer membrane protein assembly factor BamA [Propylenella binzhouense]|uniref:Outer membrane protein assembly factor BamA n=1 Tax=Propylenella binzhouense TaxID=2555902 RepID=A0A964T598_9HYPH|nr:outer membrane protein assembly factor BamA [Propylenella binzhouense]MYZ47727.1 outer membrane protein assembly factor BamA [Propylenella binzhouense]
MTAKLIRATFSALLVAAPAFSAGGAIPFGSFVSSAEAAVVNRIVVRGNERVDAETIRAYMMAQPGQSFSSEQLDESLKALYETGLFADVKVTQSGGALVVTVVENPLINRVAFEGNKRYKDEQLKGVVQSEANGVLTSSRVQSDVQRILELYRRGGRFQASVEAKTIQLPQNRVNLVYEVTEGPKTGVSRINFIGNQAFSDSRLRNVIETRESGLLSFLRRSDVYDPDRLSADEEKIRQYYLNRGYADFQIVSSVADLDRERNVFFITFTVDEGQKYQFGAIDVESVVPGIDPERLRRLVTAREGNTFSSRDVQDSIEAMTIDLAGSGYAFAQIRPRLDRNPETKTIGITFVIDEGPRAYVERIEIRGNSRTRDYVIRREFDIAEGDAFNRVLIDRAERRLKNLNYFKSVKISTEPGAEPDRVVVVVNIEEQPTGELSFGAGYSTADGVIGDISLTERNFLGRGYVVRVAVGGGESARTYEFGFTDPYFLGRRISAGFNVFRREYEDNDYRSYNFDSTGGGLTFGFPITEEFTVQLGYQIESQDINVPDYDYSTDISDGTFDCTSGVSKAVCQAEGNSLVSSVSYSLIYDSLDNRINPTDGIYAKFTQEFAGVGGDVSFMRTTAQASYYHEVLPDAGVLGLLKVQGGHIMGLGEDVRLLDAFFKGGETIRGFESSGIGPRDALTGDALGAKIYVAGTAELQFPLPGIPKEIGLRGAVFADAGTAYDTDFDSAQYQALGIFVDDSASIRSSIGASILWASPLGPLRADFAYVLTSEEYDRKQFFRIGGGTRF